MVKKAIVCIDKEFIILELLQRQLRRYLTSNYVIKVAENSQDALGIMRDLSDLNIDVPVVILDKIVHDTGGDTFLAQIDRIFPQTLKVFLTGSPDLESLEWFANHTGLYRWVMKPWQEYDLWFTIREALKIYERDQEITQQKEQLQHLIEKLQAEEAQRKFVQRELENANARLKQLLNKIPKKNNSGKETQNDNPLTEIIGESPVLGQALNRLNRVAPQDTTVLVLGETGTGKEIVSRAIHRISQRNDRPFIKVNCAALPAELIESELFGHEKGAFTGAIIKKIGRFERAHTGTVFLDEIGEMPIHLQAKLLRVIEHGEFERLGGTKTIKVDVRIIVATNRNLEEAIVQGKFRKDLYYRLNVYPVTLPPLRQRKEDIPLLADAFITRYTKKTGKYISKVPKKALKILQEYDWPGNIRELENIIERAVILSVGGTLQIEMPKDAGTVQLDNKSLKEVEKDYIIKILEITKGKIFGPNGAATRLGINPNTLRSKLDKLGIIKYQTFQK